MITFVILHSMGEVTNRYMEVGRLPDGALPVGLYAQKHGRHRSYINVQYDRFTKGFVNGPGGKRYYGKDPGYTIVIWCGKPYVIDNEINK